MKTVIFIIGSMLAIAASASVIVWEEDDIISVQEDIDLIQNDVEFIWGFNPLCKLCDKVMAKVRKEIGRDSSREHIKDALDKACTIIPKRSWRRKCRESVQGERGDRIVDMLIKKEASKIICMAMGLC